MMWELKPGDEIVSVDEYPEHRGKGQHRKMRTATVDGVITVHHQAYRITFDDGRSVICTGQHPWLSRKSNTGADWRSIEADTKKKLSVGTWVRSVVSETWELGGRDDNPHEDWLVWRDARRRRVHVERKQSGLSGDVLSA